MPSQHAFLDFLGAPPLASKESAASSDPSSSSHPPPPQSFNSPSWLAEHATLVSISRSVRSALSRRDTLLSSGNTSGGHTAGVQAKKELAVFANRLGGLARGLEEINRTERIGDGEMRRRGEMVGRLQDDCMSLGKQAAMARQASTSTVKSSFFDDAPPTAQRSALLGLPSGSSQPPTVRTFGAPPPGKETEETRPLDAGGLMFLQQDKINEQDTMLKQLSVSDPSSSATVALTHGSLRRPSCSDRSSSARRSGKRSQSRTSCSTSWTRRSTRRAASSAVPSARW